MLFCNLWIWWKSTHLADARFHYQLLPARRARQYACLHQ